MPRPRADDPDDADWTPDVATGAIAFNSWADDQRPIGRLLVPDPEARRGWREFYVNRPDPKPDARPVGFGKSPLTRGERAVR